MKFLERRDTKMEMNDITQKYVRLIKIANHSTNYRKDKNELIQEMNKYTITKNALMIRKGHRFNQKKNTMIIQNIEYKHN